MCECVWEGGIPQKNVGDCCSGFPRLQKFPSKPSVLGGGQRLLSQSHSGRCSEQSHSPLSPDHNSATVTISLRHVRSWKRDFFQKEQSHNLRHTPDLRLLLPSVCSHPSGNRNEPIVFWLPGQGPLPHHSGSDDTPRFNHGGCESGVDLPSQERSPKRENPSSKDAICFSSLLLTQAFSPLPLPLLLRKATQRRQDQAPKTAWTRLCNPFRPPTLSWNHKSQPRSPYT